MQRDVVLSLLKHHQSELTALGLLSVAIIGSTARGEARDDSDVDLAVRLSEGPRGLAHLRRLDDLSRRLAAILGCPVDVIEEPAAKPRLQREIDRDRLRAF
jgi:predicted nucleotidyltransferase